MEPMRRRRALERAAFGFVSNKRVLLEGSVAAIVSVIAMFGSAPLKDSPA